MTDMKYQKSTYGADIDLPVYDTAFDRSLLEKRGVANSDTYCMM